MYICVDLDLQPCEVCPVLLFSLNRWGNWITERSSHFSRGTQLRNDNTETGTQSGSSIYAVDHYISPRLHRLPPPHPKASSTHQLHSTLRGTSICMFTFFLRKFNITFRCSYQFTEYKENRKTCQKIPRGNIISGTNNSVSSTDKLQGERERERERGVRQREGKREGEKEEGREGGEILNLQI